MQTQSLQHINAQKMSLSNSWCAWVSQNCQICCQW